jgi:hypothetical protein
LRITAIPTPWQGALDMLYTVKPVLCDLPREQLNMVT